MSSLQRLSLCAALLLFYLTLVPVSASGSEQRLQRRKREWIIPPRQLKENHDYTGYEYIARIRSDKENYTKILYSLSGPGVTEGPDRIFGVDSNTGYVKIYSILDREKKSLYVLKGVARYTDGTSAERVDVDLRITVLDENDCIPEIQMQQVGSVYEASAEDTLVMRVIATDADEENSINSQIYFSLVEDSSTAGMFVINAHTGEVRVRNGRYLDREKQETYKVTVKAADWNGRPGGNTGTGQIEIKLLDINDNIPVLEKEWYEGSIEENTINVEVLRIKAIDMDLIHTDNWLAVYEIVSGNEGGYFSITTDAKTNEGIIMIHKPLDYESLQVLNLEVVVSNKAEYNFGSGTGVRPIHPKPYPIKINVINQREGPRFQPKVKVVTISEDHTTVSISKVITTYAAIDSDTLMTATNVRYAKNRDIDNWLIIDERTAEIRLNKMPDRESKFLVNGTYYAEIICITNERPSKTATGTIAIQVEDFNDHCPKLTATTHTMCFDDHVIYITALDQDEFPNSSPFEFSVIHGSSQGKWTVERLNATTAILRDHANLWPGLYKVAVDIKDQQGKSCGAFQTVDVTVCTCQENVKSCVLRSTKKTSFGALGILLLLLGILLLLLVPLLLLFCLCGDGAALGDFKPMPYDAKQQLISYHTEGQGEDREVPLLQVPVDTVIAGDVSKVGGRGFLEGLADVDGVVGGGAGGGAGLGAGCGMNTTEWQTEHMHRTNQCMTGHLDMDYRMGGTMGGHNSLYTRRRVVQGDAFDGMALSDQFLEEYYASKSNHAAQLNQQKDTVLAYDFEGQESPAGSVGCCSLLDNDEDLAFLNDLGPKFKTLAEICQGSTTVTESVSLGVSVPPPRPVSPVLPSTSTHTHVHTHSETVRDRDISASHVAAGSSSVFQEERISERVDGSAAVSKSVVIPGQTLLIQQPAMYYTAAPMYVVEPKPQMVLVAGGVQQAVGQVGQVGLSQGLVQVGGGRGSQGVLLVDRQVEMGGVPGQVAQGVSMGKVSRSKHVLVERGSTGGEHVAAVAQSGRGSIEPGVEVRGQHLRFKTHRVSQGSYGSSGSREDLTAPPAPSLPGGQRVVVQKVSVTERNVESSTRA